MSDLGVDRLLAGFDDAVARRSEASWPHLDRAIQALALARSEYAGLGGDPVSESMAELADRFGLGPPDASLLLVAVAAELDPTLHLLCGLLSGDDRPGRPTVALAVELAGASILSGSDRQRLTAGAPLRRYGLVQLVGDGPLLSRRLRVHDRVVAHLLGDTTPDEQIRPLLIRPTAQHVGGAERLAAVLESGEPVAWVQSPPGGAGITMAAAACARLGVGCLTADLHRAPDVGAEVSGVVRDLLLEATLQRSVLVIAGAELAVPAIPLLTHAPVPVVLVSAAPWDPQWSPVLPPVLRAGRPMVAERLEIWQRWLGDSPVDPELLALRLSPEDIELIAQRAARDAELAGQQLDVTRLRRTARRLNVHSGPDSPAANQDRLPTSMADLVLPSQARDELDRLLNWVRYRDEVLAGGNLHGVGDKGTGICALFSGSPGTGKTLAATVIADTLGMDLMAVNLAAVIDKYIGETEKNLERIFARAESLNAVLFFDEADALFGSRSAIRDAKDRYANQEIAYLLQRMEQLDGLTILATNLRGNLDPAFARRLDFIVHFPDPDATTRRELWAHHLSKLATLDPDDPISGDALAERLEIGGGDIRNIVLTAAYSAATDHSPVGMRHVLDGAVRELTKLGRRLPATSLLTAGSKNGSAS